MQSSIHCERFCPHFLLGWESNLSTHPYILLFKSIKYSWICYKEVLYFLYMKNKWETCKDFSFSPPNFSSFTFPKVPMASLFFCFFLCYPHMSQPAFLQLSLFLAASTSGKLWASCTVSASHCNISVMLWDLDKNSMVNLASSFFPKYQSIPRTTLVWWCHFLCGVSNVAWAFLFFLVSPPANKLIIGWWTGSGSGGPLPPQRSPQPYWGCMVGNIRGTWEGIWASNIATHYWLVIDLFLSIFVESVY